MGKKKKTAQVIIVVWNQGGVTVVVRRAERTGERSEKWSIFGSTPALLMLRRCSQRSETTSQQQELSLHPPQPPAPSSGLSLPVSVPLLRATQKACWGGGGRRWDGSRERHGILMGMERVREERRWWGWMEEAHTQTCTCTRVRQHHCGGLFIWMIALN